MTSKEATQNEARRLAHVALDVPHKGQASYVHNMEIIANLRTLGWTVEPYAPAPAGSSLTRNRALRILSYIGVMFEVILRMSRYHVIYIRSHPLAWPVTLAARVWRRVVVQEVNGMDIDVLIQYPRLEPFRGFVRWLYRSQYRMSDHLFPVTGQLGSWLRDFAGHDRITPVQNGVNSKLFRPVGGTRAPFVVFVGGLTAWHGVELMMTAVSNPKWPSSIELVVIGDGSRAHLVGEAIKAGLPVRWLGYRPHEQIPGLIGGALAGLVPITDPRGRSSNGTSPLKLYEMMACGIAVIATDLPGQADIVREGACGIVVPCDDASAIACAVARLAHDPALAIEMGQRGADLAHNYHTWAARAAEIDRQLRVTLGARSMVG